MIRVMLLTSSLYGGGAERVIANLATHLDRTKFCVTIAHLKERGGVGESLAAQGHDVVGIPRSEGRPGRYLSCLALRRTIHERRAQVVHTHTTYALSDAILCRMASLGRTKVVHTFHFGNYPHYPGRYRFIERVAGRAANHLVAVGIEQRQTLLDLYDLAPARLSVISNGTDAPQIALDEEWRYRLHGDGRVVIGTLATFIEQKGLDRLIDVASVLHRAGVPAVFVVVGDGALRPALEARRRAAGLDECVLFAGWKPNADATMMPLFDIFFQPSRWEAMSMVVLEAMAAGKPAVVTDVGDNRHVVTDGVTGFVVPKEDVGAMAERLRQLVESPRLRAQFGVAGLDRHRRCHTAAAMTRAYEDLYARVLGSGPPVGEKRSEGSSCAA